MSDPAPRWVPCPWCGADAEVLFSVLRCSSQDCRWFVRATREAWMAERPAAYSWVWAAPEG